MGGSRNELDSTLLASNDIQLTWLQLDCRWRPALSPMTHTRTCMGYAQKNLGVTNPQCKIEIIFTAFRRRRRRLLDCACRTRFSIKCRENIVEGLRGLCRCFVPSFVLLSLARRLAKFRQARSHRWRIWDSTASVPPTWLESTEMSEFF